MNQSPPAVHSSKYGDVQQQVCARTRTRFTRDCLGPQSIALASGSGGAACWLSHASDLGAVTAPPPELLLVQQRHEGVLVVGAHGLLKACAEFGVVELDSASRRVEGAGVAAEEGPAGERSVQFGEVVARGLVHVRRLRQPS